MLLIPILVCVALVTVAGTLGYFVGAIREVNSMARKTEARARDLCAEVIKESLVNGYGTEERGDKSAHRGN